MSRDPYDPDYRYDPSSAATSPYIMESKTEPPTSKFAVANREDHGYLEKGVRAGNLDRNKILNHLREARADERITAEQYHARCEAATRAESQFELTGIVRDLPAPQSKPEHRLGQWWEALEELEDNHHHAFHGSVATILAVIMSFASLPFLLIHGDAGSSGWIVLPVLSYFLCGFGELINLGFWIDG